MPKLECKCGDLLDYGNIPCEMEYLFISDVNFDKFNETIEHQVLYREMNSFLKCPRCGRLWIFWDGFQSIATEYIRGNE